MPVQSQMPVQWICLWRTLGRPLAFCLAYQPVLDEVARRHPDVLVLAFMDDSWLLGPPAAVAAAYQTKVALQRDGCPERGIRPCELQSNKRKVKVFTYADNAAEVLEPLADLDLEGCRPDQAPLRCIRVVGGWVGHADAVGDKLEQKVRLNARFLPNLARLADDETRTNSAQTKHALGRHCAATQLIGAMRSTPPSKSASACELHDLLVGEQFYLAHVVGDSAATPEQVEAARRQMALPVAMGGCGVLSAVLLADAAFVGGTCDVWARAVRLAGGRLDGVRSRQWRNSRRRPGS